MALLLNLGGDVTKSGISIMTHYVCDKIETYPQSCYEIVDVEGSFHQSHTEIPDGLDGSEAFSLQPSHSLVVIAHDGDGRSESH